MSVDNPPRRDVGLVPGTVRIEEYNPRWPEEFERIRERLAPVFPGARIEHVGSTSVPGCVAKPIIDLSVGLPSGTHLHVDQTRAVGLEFRLIRDGTAMFRLQGEEGRFRAHVHVRTKGPESELQDLQFRDFLRSHPEAVREYSEKNTQIAESTVVRVDYAEAKRPTLLGLMDRAKRWATETKWSPQRESMVGTDLQRPPKEIVRVGWDSISLAYRPEGAARDGLGHELGDYREWLTPLLKDLAPGVRVLDLGCGCGIPTSKMFAGRFHVTGVDISDVQISRARRLVPRAKFVHADMTEIRFPDASFEAVLALYSIIHLPLPEQRPLLERIRRWLVPGGWLVLITCGGFYEGIEENWMGWGAAMYWSHADAATYRRWLKELGFEIVQEAIVPEAGSGGHALFRARIPIP